MKRNNFRILWYIIAVALFLVAIAGLNLKLQGDHAKENKTTQSATNTKLNIALVNEDQNVSNGKESYNLGASYIKSIERDNSQNWSVVSRGTAQNGLNKGDYQLMVIIPNNFSQKLLDVNKANAEQTTISYKVNAKGNLALEKKATEKGKDIVSELNSHLVNMYMASILSNLYTAQENVQAMVNVQSGNISNYQKNLLDSATNFQNIFPALVNQSSSSITANESLKKWKFNQWKLQKGKKEQLKINYGIIFGLVMLSPVFLVGSIENIFGLIGGVLFTATFPALIVDSLYAAYYIHKHPEYE